MKKLLLIVIVVAAIIIATGFFVFIFIQNNKTQNINSFEDCLAAGYPIMESYPEQCRTPDGRIFIRNISKKQAGFGSPILLSVGQEAELDSELSISLSSIQDSRCKEGVICVWEGEISTLFKVIVGSSESEFILGTVQKNSTEIGEYVFILNSATENTATITVEKKNNQIVSDKCYISGCSMQICSDEKDVVTTCEYKEEYACYKNAKCERQVNGQCGWTQTPELKMCLTPQKKIETTAQNLKIPWEVRFLPDNTILITERPGTLAIVKNGTVKKLNVSGVYHIGEGGLLGMALHPAFSQNNFIYLYITYQSGGDVKNKVERYKFVNEVLSEKKLIIDNIPGSSNHNGGRIAFGPEGHLYITTGDSGNTALAQEINSLAGKILRVTDSGAIPQDNPFSNAVYSYGHRNPQGLAWDNNGRLWSTEHGRSGALSGFDELNLIEKGKNYGWPVIQGDETRQGMESPKIHSGASKTWAPAGLVFVGGKLFFGGLRGQALYEVDVLNSSVSNLKENFLNQFGRIRAVVAGSGNIIYITTSNTDGRGIIRQGDDKLIKIIK